MSLEPASFTAALEKICTRIVGPDAVGIDRDGASPERGIKALGEAGLLGAVSAREVGGLGLGFRGAATIVGPLAQECESTAMVACMLFSGATVLESFGPRAIRQAAAEGTHLSTLAFSESGSRSHFWAPVSTATRDNGHITLNAHKSWITSASRATAYVWSSQPLTAGAGLSTLWLVPSKTSGIQVQGSFDGLGLRGNNSSPVSADGVRVPESAMLGQDGKGFDIMMSAVLPMFNVLSAACSVGIMESAAQRTTQHANDSRYAHLGWCSSAPGVEPKVIVSIGSRPLTRRATRSFAPGWRKPSVGRAPVMYPEAATQTRTASPSTRLPRGDLRRAVRRSKPARQSSTSNSPTESKSGRTMRRTSIDRRSHRNGIRKPQFRGARHSSSPTTSRTPSPQAEQAWSLDDRRSASRPFGICG